MSHPIKCFGDIKENTSHFYAKIGIKSIVNIMSNQNELMQTGVAGTES